MSGPKVSIIKRFHCIIRITAKIKIFKAVSIRWTGLETGLWDWTVGLDSEKVVLIISSE